MINTQLKLSKIKIYLKLIQNIKKINKNIHLLNIMIMKKKKKNTRRTMSGAIIKFLIEKKRILRKMIMIRILKILMKTTITIIVFIKLKKLMKKKNLKMIKMKKI